MSVQRMGTPSTRSTRKSKLEISENSPQTEKEIPRSDLKLILDFVTNILDKQYRSYIWNDGKVQSLVTIDTALIAGILVILQIFKNINTIAFIILVCAFIALIFSFLVCLWHSIPRLNSGIGNEVNLRSMIGIVRLDKNEYFAKIMKLDLKNMVRMSSWQVSGMARNNLRSHNLIKSGVILTIIGVLGIAMAVPIIAISNRIDASAQATQLIPLPATSSPTSSLTPPPVQQSLPPAVPLLLPTQMTLTPLPMSATSISFPNSGTP